MKITKTFKYLNPHRIINRLKTLHERVKQLDPNPYSLFLNWILDVIEYGVPATIAIGLTIWLGWIGLGISFGIFVWLWKAVLNETIKTIKEQ